MTRAFLRYPITVERLTDDVGADTEGYVSNGTIYGFITSISPEDTMLSEGNPSQSAILFCEEQSDIQVGDRITYDSISYIVKSVKKPKAIFSIRYKRCVIEHMNS